MAGKTESSRAVKKTNGSENAGHRSRVRQRFLMNGFAGMLKYEVLEAMLMMVLPRRDVKPLAKKLLAEYGTVLNVISQPQIELEKFPGLGESSAAQLRIFFESMRYCLAEQCEKRSLLETPEKLRDFVRMKLGVHRHECCMIVLLTSRDYLIDYRIVAEGTVDKVLNYFRNIVELAVTRGACKLLLVHNHPSGVCEPSLEDIKATELCSQLLETMGIELLDHLIVTPSECFSFVENGMVLNGKTKGMGNG